MDRSLSKSAQQRVIRIASRSPLPSWFQALSTVMLVIFVGYLAVQFMMGTPAAPQPATTVATLPPTTTPVTAPPAQHPTGPSGPTVAVENAQQNGSVDVVASAVNLVKRIALAEVTGRTAGIPRAVGSAPVPGAAIPYGAARIQSLEVNSGSTGATQFSFLVNVSTGANGATGTYSINVVFENGGWKYTSAS